jgi:hypothetical protein
MQAARGRMQNPAIVCVRFVILCEIVVATISFR